MYKHVMVPLDGSELAECVIPHVETIVEGLKGCRVTLIRVVTPLHLYGSLESRFSPEERKRLEKDNLDITRDYLDRLRQRLKDKGIEAEEVEGLKISVIRSENPKCERCWVHDSTVGAIDQFPTICNRCYNALIESGVIEK